MSNVAPVIERNWYATTPQGDGIAVRFSIGLPARSPTGEWRALVSLDGLESATTIFGEDGWQAMALGMGFIVSRVFDYEKRGWRFYWAESGEEATSGDLRDGWEAK